MKKIIEILEDVKIEQENEVIILEKGDKIQIVEQKYAYMDYKDFKIVKTNVREAAEVLKNSSDNIREIYNDVARKPMNL